MLVLIKAGSVIKTDILQAPLAYLLRIWLLYCSIEQKKTLISPPIWHFVSGVYMNMKWSLNAAHLPPAFQTTTAFFLKASVQRQIELLAARQDTIWMINSLLLVASAAAVKTLMPWFVHIQVCTICMQKPVSRKSDCAAEASAGLRSVRISPGWNGNFILQGLILTRGSGKFLLNDHKLRKSKEFVWHFAWQDSLHTHHASCLILIFKFAEVSQESKVVAAMVQGSWDENDCKTFAWLSGCLTLLQGVVLFRFPRIPEGQICWALINGTHLKHSALLYGRHVSDSVRLRNL